MSRELMDWGLSSVFPSCSDGLESGTQVPAEHRGWSLCSRGVAGPPGALLCQLSIWCPSLHAQRRYCAEDSGTDPFLCPAGSPTSGNHTHVSTAHAVVPKFTVGIQVSDAKNLEIYKMMVCQVEEGPPPVLGEKEQHL